MSRLTGLRCGFRSKNQLPLFMMWREYYDDSYNVIYARVLFNSMDWIGI
jgi:hypothetical protein